jgi:hypothetical protein
MELAHATWDSTGGDLRFRPNCTPSQPQRRKRDGVHPGSSTGSGPLPFKLRVDAPLDATRTYIECDDLY